MPAATVLSRKMSPPACQTNQFIPPVSPTPREMGINIPLNDDWQRADRSLGKKFSQHVFEDRNRGSRSKMEGSQPKFNPLSQVSHAEPSTKARRYFLYHRPGRLAEGKDQLPSTDHIDDVSPQVARQPFHETTLLLCAEPPEAGRGHQPVEARHKLRPKRGPPCPAVLHPGSTRKSSPHEKKRLASQQHHHLARPPYHHFDVEGHLHLIRCLASCTHCHRSDPSAQAASARRLPSLISSLHPACP